MELFSSNASTGWRERSEINNMAPDQYWFAADIRDCKPARRAIRILVVIRNIPQIYRLVPGPRDASLFLNSGSTS